MRGSGSGGAGRDQEEQAEQLGRLEQWLQRLERLRQGRARGQDWERLRQLVASGDMFDPDPAVRAKARVQAREVIERIDESGDLATAVAVLRGLPDILRVAYSATPEGVAGMAAETGVGAAFLRRAMVGSHTCVSQLIRILEWAGDEDDE